jgi:type IV pilus assembly protein PilO
MAIDLNTIKKMPTNAKLGIIVLVFALIGYFYWFLFFNSAMDQKSSKTTQLKEMQDKVKEKNEVARQVKKYMDDVAILQNNYKTALQKLPDQREIPTLFHSVSSAGRDAGVEFILFEPKASVPKTMETQVAAKPKTSDLLKPSDQRAEKPADAAPPAGKQAPAAAPEPFYEEIPVGVTVTGTYQDILYFFEKVAKLPRIVNISEISMSRVADAKGKKNMLSSTFTIKTYMFIDKKEKNK